MHHIEGSSTCSSFYTLLQPASIGERSGLRLEAVPGLHLSNLTAVQDSHVTQLVHIEELLIDGYLARKIAAFIAAMYCVCSCFAVVLIAVALMAAKLMLSHSASACATTACQPLIACHSTRYE